jgi:flagellar assembly protein FliH
MTEFSPHSDSDVDGHSQSDALIGKPQPPKAPTGPRKYLFDRSFDYVPPPPPPLEPGPEPVMEEDYVPELEPEPEPEPEPPPPPPPPMFSVEELAAARTSSYADGETAGLQTAMASVEARTARALEGIAQQIPSVLADRQQVVNAVAQEAARLAHALVARMMPELARTYGIGEIQAVIRDSLAMAVDQPRLTLRVHSDLGERLHPLLEGLALNSGFTGQVSLLTDPTLGPSDVRAEWGDGGAERLVARAWADVTAIVRHSVADLRDRTGTGLAEESVTVNGLENA